MTSELSPGRIIKAPESFLTQTDIKTVWAEAKQGRRNFLRNAFVTASAGAVAAGAG